MTSFAKAGDFLLFQKRIMKSDDLINSAEFRFCYSTSRYSETVSFYKDDLQLEEFRSWDRGSCQKGTIFKSPNGAGLIEIEEGTEILTIQGELYIEVEDVDAW